MSKPQLIVSIDQPILSLNSSDCLILSRKVNKSFSTAFAVGQLTPTLPNDRALLSRNYFTWLDEFQITAWKPHDDGPMPSGGDGGGTREQTIGVCNPVEITFKQTTRFVDSVLQPAQTLGTVAWHNPPERTFAIEKLGSSFQFRVAQRTRPDGKFHPLFRSPFAPSLQGRTEIYVEDVFALFWSLNRVDPGESVKFPGEDKGNADQVQIVNLADTVPKHYRYGFLAPNCPAEKEEPGWYAEPFPEGNITAVIQSAAPPAGRGAKL